MNAKTAAALAAHCAELADTIKAGQEPGPTAATEDLMIYHVRTAARLARELAEHAARKESQPQ